MVRKGHTKGFVSVREGAHERGRISKGERHTKGFVSARGSGTRKDSCDSYQQGEGHTKGFVPLLRILLQ